MHISDIDDCPNTTPRAAFYLSPLLKLLTRCHTNLMMNLPHMLGPSFDCAHVRHAALGTAASPGLFGLYFDSRLDLYVCLNSPAGAFPSLSGGDDAQWHNGVWERAIEENSAARPCQMLHYSTVMLQGGASTSKACRQA